MTWVLDHLDDIGSYTFDHAWLAGLPLVIGLLLSIPLGWAARRVSSSHGANTRTSCPRASSSRASDSRWRLTPPG